MAIKIKRIVVPRKCPKCKSKSIISNKGSTNFIPIKSINWLCKECLYEW